MFSLKKTLEKEHQQWILWIPVLIAFGILLHEAIYINIFLGLLFILGLFFLKSTNTYLYLGKKIILFLLIGSFSMIYKTQRLLPSLKQAHYNQTITKTVRSIDTHPKRKNFYKITLDHFKLTAPFHIASQIKEGDRVTINANLLPYSLPVVPSGFNWRRHYFFQGLVGTGKINTLISVQKGPVNFTRTLRNLLKQKLENTLCTPHNLIAKALILGDTSALTDTIRNQFSQTGIAHLLAVSGLHMSLVTALVFMFIRRFLSFFPYLTQRFNLKIFSFIVALIASFFFLVISGMGFPSIRAFCMNLFIIIGLMLGKSPISLRSLCLCASFILILFPESLWSISFQLSFSAVIFLLHFYNTPPICNKCIKYFITLFLTTCLATLGTLPFTLFHFQSFSVYALFGNFIAIPLTCFIIIPFLLLGFLLPLGFKIANLGIHFLLQFTHYISKLPGADFSLPKPRAFFLPLVSLCLLWFILWKQKWRYLGLLALPPTLYASYAYLKIPDILVGHSVVGYVQPGSKTLYVSHPKRGKFEYEIWMKTYNIPYVKKWEKYPAHHKGYTLYSKQIDPKNKHIGLSNEKDSNYCIYTK